MILIISAVLMGSMLFAPQPAPETHLLQNYARARAEIGVKTYKLWIADDYRKRYLGLSYLDKMETDEGMLFILPEAAIHEFCMVEMRFPLDLIFLRGDTVVGIIENAPPTAKKRTELGSVEVFSIDVPSDRVIELNAGEVKKNKIKIDDRIILR